MSVEIYRTLINNHSHYKIFFISDYVSEFETRDESYYSLEIFGDRYAPKMCINCSMNKAKSKEKLSK